MLQKLLAKWGSITFYTLLVHRQQASDPYHWSFHPEEEPLRRRAMMVLDSFRGQTTENVKA
jgi:hypothetical protein